MRLTPLLNTDTTVDTRINKAFTMPANEAAIFSWQSYPCPHGYFSSDSCIPLRQLWLPADILFSQFKESTNALQRYLPSLIHQEIPKPRFAEDMKRRRAISSFAIVTMKKESTWIRQIQQLQVLAAFDSNTVLHLRSQSIHLEWADQQGIRSSNQNGAGNLVQAPCLDSEHPQLSCVFLFLL